VKTGGMRAAVRDLGTLFNEGAVGMLTDGQLLDRFVERREASAFEAIVERYGPLVWGVYRRVLRDHHDAEDAFQATFLVLMRKAASVMPREKLGNWLYGVAIQAAMKARATRAKRRVRERPAWTMTEPESVPDEYPDEQLSRLDREVTRLPEKYRVPIILCELEGKTHRQAAEHLGWPVGTVSCRLSRARALLASRLSRPEMPLTAGALTVLLAYDVASACVPPELVILTAQAATLATAGKAVTAGVVSAEAAALTGEVLKAMLLNKLKIITATLVMISAFAAGGTALSYGTQTAEPAVRRQALQRLIKERTEELERLTKDLEGLTAENKEDLPRFKQWLTRQALPEDDEQQVSDALQPTLRWGGYIFSASPTGNRAIAYNPVTREEKSVQLNATKEQPLRVTPEVINPMSPPRLVGLRLEGQKITRLAVFDLESGKWLPKDLEEPAKGDARPKCVYQDGTAYDLRPHFYTFSLTRKTWDHLDIRVIRDRVEDGDAGTAPDDGKRNVEDGDGRQGSHRREGKHLGPVGRPGVRRGGAGPGRPSRSSNSADDLPSSGRDEPRGGSLAGASLVRRAGFAIQFGVDAPRGNEVVAGIAPSRRHRAEAP
jgi:RNA polymerase sigma factor (sigma-70 family)